MIPGLSTLLTTRIGFRPRAKGCFWSQNGFRHWPSGIDEQHHRQPLSA
jgi:hypothetical protein